MFQLNTAKPIHFIIVGTGGTGGHLIENLARLLDTQDIEHVVTLIDGDKVESKNLLRQNFYQIDLGQNKARALVERYSRLFPHTKLLAAPAYLSSPQELLEILSEDPQPVIISAVDNNATRHLIKQAITQAEQPLVWLDAGNAERTGQVVVGTHQITTIQPAGSFVKFSEQPDCIDKFPEAFANTDSRPDELSCADHSLEAPQDIAANVIAASTLFMIVNRLIHGELITQNVVNFDTIGLKVGA